MFYIQGRLLGDDFTEDESVFIGSPWKVDIFVVLVRFGPKIWTKIKEN